MRAAVRSAAGPSSRRRFVFYVEGPRDRGLVETWARALSRPLSRWVARETVILGGCQPARAGRHFEVLRSDVPELAGLCLLDRDHGEDPPAPESGSLRFFTWSRRHIESYLLVPEAIRRSVRLPANDRRVDRFFRDHLPDLADEDALRRVNAKPLFARYSGLSEAVGRSVSAARVARAMRAEDLHSDVRSLLDQLLAGAGYAEPTFSVRVAREGSRG